MVVQAANTRLHTWPFLSIFVEIYSRDEKINIRRQTRSKIRSSSFEKHVQSPSVSKILQSWKISREGSSVERRRTLSFIVWMFRERKKEEDFPMETRRTNMCVPSAIERNPEAEISFHLGDSVKKFTRTRPWTALWERKKRFHPFSPSFFFSLSSSSFRKMSRLCPTSFL